MAKRNKFLTKIMLLNKCRKLHISIDLLDFMIDRISNDSLNYENKEILNIINIIKKSKNSEEFKDNIIKYCKTNDKLYFTNFFLLGTITGKYEFITILYSDYKGINYDNYKDINNILLDKLRDNFYEYVNSNNNLKNEFLLDEKRQDLRKDLDKDFVLEVFDDVINPKKIKAFDVKSTCKKIAYEYIINVIGIYKSDILNNFDFIIYDMNQKTNEDINIRRKKFLERKNLSKEQMSKLDNLDELRNKLNIMNTNESLKLIDRLNEIKGNELYNIEEIEDIYLEYEILLREEMLNKLYNPSSNYTLVEDFRNLRPQLVHLLLRSPERFKDKLQQDLKDKIISERIIKNESDELTKEELEEFEKRKHLLDKQMDFSVVNQYYESGKFLYNDANGINSYISDTSNQISTTYFNPVSFINECSGYIGFMGIGFNSDGVPLESIALSSKNYITTNKGIYNIELNENNDFKNLSNNTKEIEISPFKSEIVLFRRNIDSDTKASYLFVIVSSDESRKEQSEKALEEAIMIANKNNLKLVIYDIYKIKKSYEEYINNKDDVKIDENGKKI